MPRTILLCSGICLLSTADIYGQSLPKNPTPQQVVGYRIVEQQRWNAQQLPRSSVLYKSDRKNAGWQSQQFSFKKKKQPAINLTSTRPFVLQNNGVMNSSASSQQLHFLKANLFQQKQLYSQWQKESWLKDLQGSLWLREFLIQSKNKNSFHLSPVTRQY